MANSSSTTFTTTTTTILPPAILCHLCFPLKRGLGFESQRGEACDQGQRTGALDGLHGWVPGIGLVSKRARGRIKRRQCQQRGRRCAAARRSLECVGHEVRRRCGNCGRLGKVERNFDSWILGLWSTLQIDEREKWDQNIFIALFSIEMNTNVRSSKPSQQLSVTSLRCVEKEPTPLNGDTFTWHSSELLQQPS